VNSTDDQEQLLLDAARRGERAAYGRLVERHAGQVFRVCYRVSGNESMAEDAVQETFIRAWRNLGGFDGRAAFSTWLHRIAVNSALEQLRREGRHRAEAVPADDQLAGAAWTDSTPGPERLTASAQLAQRMSRSLEDLTALERAAFVLRHHEDMPIAEICAALKLRPSAAKQAIFRAVKKMRAALQEFHDETGVSHATGE
jgi:RNA polymerase sigma-70 factor (ECF subfamily)